MTTFVDTSALYALLDDGDVSHSRAGRVLEALRGTQLVTHNYVVVETVSLVSRRLGWAGVDRLAEAILPLIDASPVDAELHGLALSTYLASGSSRVSLVDRTSFAFMRRAEVTRAFAFDDDFAREGFKLA